MIFPNLFQSGRPWRRGEGEEQCVDVELERALGFLSSFLLGRGRGWSPVCFQLPWRKRITANPLSNKSLCSPSGGLSVAFSLSAGHGGEEEGCGRLAAAGFEHHLRLCEGENYTVIQADDLSQQFLEVLVAPSAVLSYPTCTAALDQAFCSSSWSSEETVLHGLAAPIGISRYLFSLDAVLGSTCFSKDQLRIAVQVVFAIFISLGCVRRRQLRSPLLLLLRFSGEDPPKLCSVMLLQYLQLNSQPRLPTPFRWLSRWLYGWLGFVRPRENTVAGLASPCSRWIIW